MSFLNNTGFLKTTLFVSLALNLVVVGAIGSFLIGKRHKDPRIAEQTQGPAGSPRGGIAGPLGVVVSGFDRSERRAFGRQLRQAFETAGYQRPDRKAAFGELKRILAADTFDAAAFQTVFETEHDQMLERSQVALNTMVAYLNRLAPAERQAIASKMKLSRRGQRK